MRGKVWFCMSFPALTEVLPIRTRCPNHVLAVFPGPCLHPVFWGRPWATFSAFATGTPRPSRHLSRDMGHLWLLLVTFDLVSCREKKSTFGIDISEDCETSQVNEFSMKWKCLVTSMGVSKVRRTHDLKIWSMKNIQLVLVVRHSEWATWQVKPGKNREPQHKET